MATSLSILQVRVGSAKLRIKRQHRDGHYPELVFIAANGRPIMMARVDQIFDGDGNLFEDDL